MEEILFRMKREVIEDVAIIGGLVGVQFVYAGNAVLLSYVMSLGLDPLTIVIFSTLSTFIVLSPIAAYFERHTWPKKISLKFLIQLLLIAFGGVTLFQTLFLKGIQLTSPAMAAAMPNLAPGFIFVIACTVRLERVKISCLYSKMKILGTILCVVGAITMSLMQSTTSPTEAEAQPQFRAISPESLFDKQKIIGCLYLLAAVFVLSSNIVLQATTLGDFPAPMSLCAITSLIGVFLTAAVQFIQDHKIETGWPLVSAKQLIGFSLLGGVVSGACVSFNGWAMKKRGPVLVSMFSPIGTVCSVVLSVITLGDAISVGSFAGMCLMFTGLYFFLWAKGKEGYLDVGDLERMQSSLPALAVANRFFQDPLVGVPPLISTVIMSLMGFSLVMVWTKKKELRQSTSQISEVGSMILDGEPYMTSFNDFVLSEFFILYKR